MKLAWIWPFMLSGVILWAFWRYDFSEAVKAYHTIDWPLIGLSFIFNVCILYFRAYKWALVFKPMAQRLSHFNGCLSVFAGCLVNMVVPARAGGLVQAWIIGRKEHVSVSAALGTVTLVRIFDSAMLVFLGLWVFIFLNIPKAGNDYIISVIKAAGSAGFFLVILVIILFMFTRNPNAMDRMLFFLFKFLPGRLKPGTTQAVIGFRQGLMGLNSVWIVGFSLLLSLVFWLLCAVNVYILLNALGLEVAGIISPILLLLAQAFSMGIPAPANAGPYHAATITVLALYGIPSQSALYAAVIMHGVMFISNTFPGLLYLWLDKTEVVTMLKGINDVRRNLQ